MKKKTQAINQEFLDRARSLDRENRSVSKKLRKKAPWTGKATCGFQTNYVPFSAHTDATEHDSLSRSLQS